MMMVPKEEPVENVSFHRTQWNNGKLSSEMKMWELAELSS